MTRNQYNLTLLVLKRGASEYSNTISLEEIHPCIKVNTYKQEENEYIKRKENDNNKRKRKNKKKKKEKKETDIIILVKIMCFSKCAFVWMLQHDITGIPT